MSTTTTTPFPTDEESRQARAVLERWLRTYSQGAITDVNQAINAINRMGQALAPRTYDDAMESGCTDRRPTERGRRQDTWDSVALGYALNALTVPDRVTNVTGGILDTGSRLWFNLSMSTDTTFTDQPHDAAWTAERAACSAAEAARRTADENDVDVIAAEAAYQRAADEANHAYAIEDDDPADAWGHAAKACLAAAAAAQALARLQAAAG